MKKKVLFCALLSAAAVSAAAFAGCNLFGGGGGGGDNSVTQDYMRFELKEDGTYELARYEYAQLEDGEDRDGNFVPGYSGDGETVNVPETVNGKAVTSVAEYAFCGTGVKSVTFPEAISVLPDRIFESCSLLTTVNFSTVTSVGELAFYECLKLTGIEFKSGLTEIGDRAFGGCAALATVTLPDTVTTIGENCFYQCAFESINTAGVETLGKGAFYKCENITALNLSNVVSIGEGALRFCNSMTEITIGDRLESIEERPFADNPALKKVSISSPVPAKMFMWNKTVTEVTLGEGVTSIGESAFAYCSGVTEITLPATLTEIGENAFSQSGLTELTIENGVESIGAGAFERTAITSLSLPASVKALGDNAFRGCNAITTITLAEGLESIGSQALAIIGDEAMEIVLPSTVKSLGDMCFGSIAAKKLTINQTVETVGENILKGCKVRELTVPANYGHNAAAVETLTVFGEGEIPNNAYSRCTVLKTVNLSSGVKKIGAYAFAGLEKINLDSVEIIGVDGLGNLSSLTYTKTENGVNYIDNWVISSDYSQGGATTLDLSGVTGIYQNAFKKTDNNDTSVLTTVILVGSDDTSSIKQIGQHAFDGTGITAVEVPAGIQNWNYAFYGCKSLLNIAIQRGVEKIADNAFKECTNLSGVNLAASDVTEIGANAFYNCTALRLVTLPNAVKKIGEYAFSYCSSLMTIDLKGTEEIGERAFSYCSKLSEVTMNSVKKIGGNAFMNCNELTEYDLPVSVTEICGFALNDAQTVNYAGTKEQWEAISKGKDDPWYADGAPIWYRNNDLTIIFADGSSITLPKE